MPKLRLIAKLLIGLFFLTGAPAVDGQEIVNINTAGSQGLQELHGIGPTYAERIIEYRNSNQGFSSIEEIQEVKGIGAKTFADIKDHITVGKSESTTFDESSETVEDNNADQSKSQSEGDSSSNSSDSSGDQSTELEESPLSLSIEYRPTTVLAGSPVTLTARGIIDGHQSRAARYSWNLGDGTIARGERVEHTYSHPGTYTVFLRAATREQEKTTTQTVTVLEPQVEIAAVSSGLDGAVIVANRLDRRVDLSDWLIQSGGQSFTLPSRTYLAGDSQAAFRPAADRFLVAEQAALRLPDGSLVDFYSESAEVASNSAADRSASSVNRPAAGPVGNNAERSDSTGVELAGNTAAEQSDTSAATSSSTSVAVVVGAGTSDGEIWSWGLLLIGVLILAGLGVFTSWLAALPVSEAAENDHPVTVSGEEAESAYSVTAVRHYSDDSASAEGPR